jgi:hypothetical protein
MDNVPDSDVDELLAGIKKASAHGATALPSTDMGPPSEALTHDTQARVDYVPPPSHQGYIPADDAAEQRAHNQQRFDDQSAAVMNEVSVGASLAVLYFLFQLPFFKKYVGGLSQTFTMPATGNYSIVGTGVVSALFGLVYYLLQRGLKIIQ